MAVEAFEREVNNGGYSQFFTNLSREYSPIIVESLRRIGCGETADLTQNAVRLVEEVPIVDEDLEDGVLIENEERDSALSDCDDRFFANPENIEDSLFAFIKANRSNIQL